VDVQACFDTIEQTKLLQILRQLISEVLRIPPFLSFWLTSFQDSFMIQKYGQVNIALGRIKKSYVKKAVPEG
jgi:telomerase reverse transcriptase